LKTMSLTKGSGYRCATNLGAVFHIRVSAPTRCSETLDLRAEVMSTKHYLSRASDEFES